jgi:hypothetical protein
MPGDIGFAKLIACGLTLGLLALGLSTGVAQCAAVAC